LWIERVLALLEKKGELFTLGANSYYGVFKPLDSGTMRTYLDDVEVMAVVKPALLLITHANVPVAVNNQIVRDGRIYTVLKIVKHRLGNSIMAITAVLS
jgi:hypothetical protein